MNDVKRTVIDGTDMWQSTKFRYIIGGTNWAWGRNQVENRVWAVLFSTTLISFVVGAGAGTWLGLKIWNWLSSYDMGYWPIVWTVLLALAAGVALTIIIVPITYRVLLPVIEAARNLADSSKHK